MYTREDVKVGDFVKFAFSNEFGMHVIPGRVIFVDEKWILARDAKGRVHDVLYSSVSDVRTPVSNPKSGQVVHPKIGKKGKAMRQSAVEIQEDYEHSVHMPRHMPDKSVASLQEMKDAVDFAVHLNEQCYRAKMIDLALATRDEELFMTWSKGVAI